MSKKNLQNLEIIFIFLDFMNFFFSEVALALPSGSLTESGKHASARLTGKRSPLVVCPRGVPRKQKRRAK